MQPKSPKKGKTCRRVKKEPKVKQRKQNSRRGLPPLWECLYVVRSLVLGMSGACWKSVLWCKLLMCQRSIYSLINPSSVLLFLLLYVLPREGTAGQAHFVASKPQMVLKGKMNLGRGDRLTNVSDFKAVLRPVIVCVRERSRIITVPLRKCCW